jgi:hypothetical protein
VTVQPQNGNKPALNNWHVKGIKAGAQLVSQPRSLKNNCIDVSVPCVNNEFINIVYRNTGLAVAANANVDLIVTFLYSK